MKYYVVWKGFAPGIYTSWPACQEATAGYPLAKFKSYPTLDEAASAYAGGIPAMNTNTKKKKEKGSPYASHPYLASDGSSLRNNGETECRVVFVRAYHEPIEILYDSCTYKQGTNNLAEFLGIVNMLKLYCKMREEGRMPHNQQAVVMYTDSETALTWVRKGKANSTFALKEESPLYRDVQDAEKWLVENKSRVYSFMVHNLLRKWRTHEWHAEIPADYNRK